MEKQARSGLILAFSSTNLGIRRLPYGEASAGAFRTVSQKAMGTRGHEKQNKEGRKDRSGLDVRRTRGLD